MTLQARPKSDLACHRNQNPRHRKQNPATENMFFDFCGGPVQLLTIRYRDKTPLFRPMGRGPFLGRLGFRFIFVNPTLCGGRAEDGGAALVEQEWRAGRTGERASAGRRSTCANKGRRGNSVSKWFQRPRRVKGIREVGGIPGDL